MYAQRLLSLMLVLWVAGCAAGQPGAGGRRELVALAASSLTDAFNELAAAFEAHNEGVVVILNYAGSSQLAAQLAEGAAADVFASANATQMQNVMDMGRIAPGSAVQFATNQLTIAVPAGNPAEIGVLEDLARPGVQLILAAEGVPVRQYTDDVLAGLPVEVREGIHANLVSAEDNVRQVLAKIALGEADAGIVYTSDVTPDLAGQVRQITIPAGQNIVASYPIAPLADAPQPELAHAFIDFVLSVEGQRILSAWGFGPPPGN